MNHSIALASLCSISIIFAGCSSKLSNPAVFYVAPDGNDTWSGRSKDPNTARTDGPFASLEKARDAIRTLKATATLPDGGITVYIRGGVYTLHETFRLTADDSGTESAPITWSAYPGEEVRFFGGKVIHGFNPITDQSVLERLSKAHRDKILQVDLKAQGITDFGEMEMTGMGLPERPTALKLFFKGEAMPLARYPNEGWLQITDVPQTGRKLIHEGVTHTPKDGIPRGRHYGRFTYSGDRPKHWGSFDDIWLHGYWSWDWADAYIKIDRIDTLTGEIYPIEPHYHYGYTKEQRFYFLNILEELDEPGEWYLDRQKGVLYFWPPGPFSEGDVAVPMLNEVMLTLQETSHISIERIIFDVCRAGGIIIEGGHHNKVAGCAVRNVGNNGIVVNGGHDNGVVSCDVHDTGDGGVIIIGGDRTTLTSARNYATNNHLYRFSRINLTSRRAIRVEGVGNVISHNYIHDAPHEAIYLKGNEHIIEYNEIHDIVKETGDAGAIHTGRDYTWRGNIIRFNYFHHLHGPGLFGVMGVYLDDFMSGTTVYGNVFYKAGRAAFMGGGRDNVIENNIFVDCDASVHIDARGLTWARNYFDGRYTVLTDRMKAVNYDKPPYSERYPELLTYYDDEPAVPKGNRVLRNVSFGGKWLDIEDGVDASLLEMHDNLIADSVLCYWRGPEIKDAPTGTVYRTGDQEFMKKLEGNTVVSENPGFVDIEKGDFRLRKDSPAWRLGFKRIPFEKIGLYTDEFRTSLPNN